jgi:hypothetical protein
MTTLNSRAFSGLAFQADLTAKKLAQFAADGQAETCAAIFAAGRSVGLLEGFEDKLVLVSGMPMPVSLTVNSTKFGWAAEGPTASVTDPLEVNLKALASSSSGSVRAASCRSPTGRGAFLVHNEIQVEVLVLRDRVEQHAHIVDDLRHGTMVCSSGSLPDSIRERSRISSINCSNP